MKFKNVAAVGAIALTAAIALSACSAATTPTATPTPTAAAFVIDPTLKGTITAGGSSAQANAEAAWTAAFTATASGVTINYDKSQGSGGGVTNFLAGSYDFAGSDSPLSADNNTKSQTICGPGGALNFPVYLSGVAIIYNVAGVTNLQLSSATLAKIFMLQITTWNDPAIAADNKGVTLPSTPITVVTRSDGSGTTANFTNYLTQVQPSIFTGKAGSAWPIAGTSGQQGGSGVVNTVKAGDGTIGYADHSSIGTLNAAAIQSGSGSDFVSYSPDAASAGFEAAAVPAPLGTGDLSKKIDYTKISGASEYPIPLLSYIIACSTFKDPAQAALVKSYVGFIGSDLGQQVAVKNAGAAPVPASILADFTASLALIK